MEYPSQRIADAVEALSRLPGIGRKTALRLALHLLKTPSHEVEHLSGTLVEMVRNIRRCKICHNITDTEVCNICASPRRDRSLVCVVADTQDVIALEKTGQYNGLYHVLGGLISPMEGVSPQQLHIESLLQRVEQNPGTEVILALAANMEGETTSFYLARKLSPLGVRLTNIARGIPVGSELEFTDDLTLARSLQQRVPYVLPSAG